MACQQTNPHPETRATRKSSTEKTEASSSCSSLDVTCVSVFHNSVSQRMDYLTTAPGKLCVSVIEARNVLAEDIAEPKFYVRLRLGPHEVKTDVVKDTTAPKFLKDARMDVDRPETDVLRVELLQVGPRGDLILGREELRVLTITSKGTVVQWMALRIGDEDVSAELCLVMRYLSASANRPMSPSYAIAARSAKERALDSGAPPNLRGLQAPVTKQLFQDEIDLSPRSNKPRAEAAKPAFAAEHKPSASPSVPLLTPPPLTSDAEPSVNSAADAAPAVAPATPAAAAPPAAAVAASPEAVGAAPPRPRAEGSGGAASSRSGGAGRGRGAASWVVPLPLAVLSGLVTGAIVFFVKKRPTYYAVREGEALSTIGKAVHGNGSTARRLFDGRSKDILDDLNLVFPGDRLRIR